MEQNTEVLLRELADKLGTTTEKLFSILVKQAKPNIYKAIFGMLFMLALSAILIFAALQFHYKSGDEFICNNVFFWALWIIGFVVWCFTASEIYGGVNIIIDYTSNPEAQAIYEILNYITPDKD